MPGSSLVNTNSSVHMATSYTVQVKQLKSSCPDNQEGLDRLQESLMKAQSNPNSNMIFSVRRAIKSLQECKHPITTQKEALQLKNVGPALAKVILGSSSSSSKIKSDSNNHAKNEPGTKKGPRPPRVKVAPPLRKIDDGTDSAARSVTVSTSSTASSAENTTLSSSGLSKKESTYQKEKQAAENLQLPPQGPWKVILIVDGRERKSQQVVSACQQSGIPCEERHLPIGDMAWIAQCIEPKECHEGQQQSSTISNNKPIEIMIGTIIERKDVGDLASSLFGTRYAEQRLRLQQCGIAQVLFLVEGDVTQVQNCASETLEMAMMETRVVLGFQVIQTKHLAETVRVLKGLHRRIVQRTFPDAFGKLPVPTYVTDPNEPRPRDTAANNNLNKGRRRNRRVSSLLEMVFDTPPVPAFGSQRFITYPELKAKVELDRERGTRSVQAITLAMLKQIPTLSLKKCTAIAQQYPTMNRLLEALSYCQGDPEKLIQNISIDRRTVGPKSATEVHAACCTLEDGSIVTSHQQEPSTTATTKGRKDSKQRSLAPKKQSSASANTSPAHQLVGSNKPNSRKRHAVETGDGSAIDVGTPARKHQAVENTIQETIDLLTPDAKPKRNVSSSRRSQSDLSGWSSGTGSTKTSNVVNPTRTTKSVVPRQQTSSRAGLDDSLLLSSPESNHGIAPTVASRKRPAQALNLKEQSTKACTNLAIKTIQGAGDPSNHIDIMDSDTDDDNDVKKRFEDDLQKAIGASLSDTPNIASTLDTPSLKTPGRFQAARKVSNNSDDGEDQQKPQAQYNSFSMSSQEEQEPSSLRDRLAKRLDKEIIEIMSD